MRFGLVHRIMTDALAALGVLALVASGELGRWIGAAIVLGLAAALAVPEGWQGKAALKHVASAGPLALLGVQLVRLFAFDASTLELAVEFAAGLQLVRLATRRGAAHDQQVIVLALLHLIAGTVLGGGLGYGLCFVGFLVVAPGALVLSHLRREVEGNYRQGARDRTGLPVDVPRILRSRRVVGRTFLGMTCLLSIPIFAFTAALFIVFPRVGLSLLLLNHGKSGRMIGFSDRVDLGNVGTLRSDPTIALRVEVPNLPDPPPPRLEMHLRGTAFDTYDGRTWSRSRVEREPVALQHGMVWIKRPPDPAHDRKMVFDLEPIEPPVLFLPQGAVAMQVRQRGEAVLGSRVDVWAGSEGELRYSGTDERGARYEVYLGDESEPSPDVLTPADATRYLAVPVTLPARIAELAKTIAADRPTPRAKAQAVEEYLRTHYKYDLASPAGRAADPLDDFLFESRRGHCEFYSTAMVILLRELGVPARNVTGFIGGTYNRFGHYYAVRQGDAHSWVEVFLDGRGWTTFDPTPPSDAAPRSELSGFFAFLRDVVEATSQRWDRYVVGYDLHQQVSLFERLTEASRKSGLTLRPRMTRPRAIGLIVAGAVLVAGAGLWAFGRKRDPRGNPGAKADRRERERLLATALYESLEGAMAAQGIARGIGTPPLRHAEALGALGHPLAAEVIALTRVYLEARFGGASLSEDLRRDFESRVRKLRATRLSNRTA